MITIGLIICVIAYTIGVVGFTLIIVDEINVCKKEKDRKNGQR